MRTVKVILFHWSIRRTIVPEVAFENTNFVLARLTRYCNNVPRTLAFYNIKLQNVETTNKLVLLKGVNTFLLKFVIFSWLINHVLMVSHMWFSSISVVVVSASVVVVAVVDVCSAVVVDVGDVVVASVVVVVVVADAVVVVDVSVASVVVSSSSSYDTFGHM